MQTDSSNLPSCPFRGLDAFSENDRDYFFGREEDATTIGANVLTAPLTVLYGASGVGKSSTIMAGVMPMLRGQRNVTIVLFRSWQEPQIIPALNQAVEDAVFARTSLHVDKTGGFDLCVASAVASTNAPVAILFDQFEEFLQYHGPQSEYGIAFDAQFARLVNRPDAPASFLISIREDWLARLDRFHRHIPNLLSNVIRLEHLDLEGARRATTKPIEKYNDELRLCDPESEPYSIETELVEIILNQVRAGAELRAGEVTAELASAGDTARVETPFLQMILIALWETEQTSGSRRIRASTLSHLGGAAHIVHSYIGRIVSRLSRDQQELCVRMFDRLVTPSATKIAHSAQDLTDYAQASAVAVTDVLEELTKNRILRQVVSPSVTCYEIFHDVLARPILNWRNRYLRAGRARTAKRRLVAVSAALALIMAIAIGLYARHWRNDQKHEQADQLLTQARVITEPAAAGDAATKYRRAFQLYSESTDQAELAAVDEAVVTSANRFKGDAALKIYEVATDVAQTPSRKIRAWTQVGRLRFEKHDSDGAREAARQAMTYASESRTTSPRSWLRIGELQMNLADRPKAIMAFKHAIEQSKKTGEEDIAADCYYNIGLLEYQDGHPWEAIASLEKAVDLQKRIKRGDTPITLSVLAYLSRQLGKTEEASQFEKDAAQALENVLRSKTSNRATDALLAGSQ